MTSLPLEHKKNIQQTYLALSEIRKEIPAVTEKLTLCLWVHWGSLVLCIVWLGRYFFGTGWPAFVCTAGVSVFLASWPVKIDLKRKLNELEGRAASWRGEMKDIGVVMTGSFGEPVQVYSGHFSDGSIDPLDDSSYK